MGVIRKKAGTRGTEGGLKYICDVCSVDITSTVRIHCADPACNDFDLCVPCFSKGSSSRDHNPATHGYSVIEQHSIPIFTEDWGADEELALLEGAEVYGLGSWADIADHIGGYRNKEEVRDHYISTYVNSSHFPLPARADPKDTRLTEEIPREEFQARKKRRIEERKETARNAPPAAPKQKPTSSIPSCHEIQGYMPGRLEFETEFYNDAEEAVQHMQFEPGDGLNPRTGEVEPEMELKMAVMDIYNSKLTARATRKRSIFEHGLLEYRRNNAVDKRRSKEERDLANRAKPFARMVNFGDYADLVKELELEHNLRQAIDQLFDWRVRGGLGDLKSGEKYEADRLARQARPAAAFGSAGGVGSAYDRTVAGSRAAKPAVPLEIPPSVMELTAPTLPERLKANVRPHAAAHGVHINGAASTKDPPLVNGTSTAMAPRAHLALAPMQGIAPIKLPPDTPDLHLLTAEERELCAVLNFRPKAYLAIKDALLREATKAGGQLRRKSVREVCRVDVQKSARLWDFFVRSGWVQRV